MELVISLLVIELPFMSFSMRWFFAELLLCFLTAALNKLNVHVNVRKVCISLRIVSDLNELSKGELVDSKSTT